METLTRNAQNLGALVVPTDNRLREIRRAQNKTLRECASAVGVTLQAIHKAERRSDALRMSKWKKLAAFLNTPLHEIV